MDDRYPQAGGLRKGTRRPTSYWAIGEATEKCPPTGFIPELAVRPQQAVAVERWEASR